MDARYVIRKTQLLDECQVAPEMFEQVIPCLSTFLEPFVTTFQGRIVAQPAKTSAVASPACLCKASSTGLTGTMCSCALS